jgi:hypothetical protein
MGGQAKNEAAGNNAPAHHGAKHDRTGVGWGHKNKETLNGGTFRQDA